MTDEESTEVERRFNRRRYLATVGLGAATATAGCTVSFDEGIEIEFGNPEDESQTPTDVGYGGTATATTVATVATTASQSATDDTTDSTDSQPPTDTETDSPSPTETETQTATSTPEDDYGDTGYGRLDYGG